MRTSARVLSLVLSVLLMGSALYAQKTSGTITGTVTDPTGAAIVGASVTSTNAGTGATRQATTDAQGNYTFPDLDPGVYTISIKNAGFKEYKANNVVLNVASTRRADAKLTPGGTMEVVNVEANAVQVQTDSASLGEVVDGQQVRELPLNGRSFVELTQLQPGVSAANNFSTINKGLLAGVDFSVNGNPTTNNLFLVDGANNNDVGSNRTILVYPSLDAISEFKMLRNSYGPEYGDASGAVVSIVTRGGENTFHGSVSYDGRNDFLNSHEYFAARHDAAIKAQGLSLPNDGKDELRRNDLGLALGGPIKKDKLFFFYSEELNREIRGFTRQNCVPSAAERAGDFSGALNCGATRPNLLPADQAPGNPFKIANPSPAGLLIAQELPLPNVTPSAATGGNNWFASLGSPLYYRQENARVDWNVTAKNAATFRYTQDHWWNDFPNDAPSGLWGEDPFPAIEGNWKQPSKSAVAKLTTTVTNTLVNEAQFSYSGNAIITTVGGTNAALAAQMNQAIPTVFPKNGKLAGGTPTFWGGAFAPYANFGAPNIWSIAPYGNNMDLYAIRDDMSKVHGNHTYKAGVYLSYNSKNEDQYGGQDQPTFGSAQDWAVTRGTGNALATLLTPSSVFANVPEQDINPTDQGRWRDYEFYVGDTWKATRNLTLDYGFRWSFLREPYAADGRMASFSLAAYDPNKPASDLCNGVVIVPGTNFCSVANQKYGTNFSAGTPGVNNALVNNNDHDIAPRLGIAWDMFGNGKTAIRTGVGQFYQRERVSPQVGLNNTAPFALTATLNRPLDSAPALTPAILGGSGAHGKDPRGVTPNSWQWNFSVEQQLARDTSIELAYVGNRGIHLTSYYDLNQVPTASRVQAAFLTQGGDVNKLRPAPNYGTISFFSRNGDSYYNALQVLFRSRFGNHSNLQLSYTWSHSIATFALDDSSGGINPPAFTDLSNTRLDRGNSTINRPNIFVANAVFYLPKLNDANGFVKSTLGGWEFNTITTAEQGNSTTIFAVNPSDAGGTSLGSLSGTGYTNNLRPDVVPGVSCTSGRNGDQIFNPAAFTFTGFRIGTIGNAPRGACLGPNNVDFDLALYKNFQPLEKLRVQFRLDAFNAFNHPNFRGDLINTNFGSSYKIACGNAPCSPTNNLITNTTFTGGTNTFGQSTLTKGGREIQYGIKFIF
ncbi:MAG TPA: carboxypeptidase regulatory-like domain-containing protein [Terriglobales bacterium]|nr:carboxypeptidase regulatory-like domain-containing protein [Terriglobales bacterium]